MDYGKATMAPAREQTMLRCETIAVRLAFLTTAVVFALAGPSPTKEAAAGQVMKLDFGSKDSPLAEGFTRVTPESAYTDEAGFGWKTKLRVAAVVDDWWNPDQPGGMLSAYDTAKGTSFGSDYCFGYHFFGWKHTEQDRQGFNRLGIKMDDDLKTDFVVKVRPGEYSLLIGMGALDVDHRYRPWRVDVNGKALLPTAGGQQQDVLSLHVFQHRARVDVHVRSRQYLKPPLDVVIQDWLLEVQPGLRVDALFARPGGPELSIVASDVVKLVH